MPQINAKSNELIMVVEDDPLNQKIVANILKNKGYRILAATDGEQCLKMVQQQVPHLILMDINMPALDGIETCRRLKLDGSTRGIPVIFVTGSTDDKTLEAAFNAGGTDYVRKPVSRVELLVRVRSALDQKYAVQKLAEDEKLKGVLETAGGVCHELNQPLQYILGAIQILMLDVDENGQLYKSLDAVRASVEQMGDITRKLTAITYYRTRKYAGDHDIIDIHQSIDGIDSDAH